MERRVKIKKSGRPIISIEEIQRGFQSGSIPERKISKVVTEHYGVLEEIDEDGETTAHYYPYTNAKGEVVVYKKRLLPKTFSLIGDTAKITQLFGQHLATGRRKLVITEGELDCLAVAQAQYDKYKKHYPVVSLPSATQTSLVIQNRAWIRSFDEVILCLDTDEPGQKASEKLIKMIGYDKVKIAKYPEKDPCEVLIQRGSQALMEAIFDARTYTPDGIVSGEAVWAQYKALRNVPAVPYPACLPGVNEKLLGMRAGEIVLLVSGTGAGKSTLMKEILLELQSYEQDETINKIGTLFLEESIGDSAEKLIGMHLKKNLLFQEVEEQEERQAFEELFSDERLILLDHQGAVEDESIVDRIEYMILMGCTHIFLDHITIAVSDGMDGKSGNEAVDHLMSQLLKLVKKYQNVWICVVSHLRKVDNRSVPFEAGRIPSLDDIKGSGSIKQISFDVLAFARNMTATDEQTRNTIKLRVLKARKTGNTGDAGALLYNRDTTRLEALTMDFDNADDM